MKLNLTKYAFGVGSEKFIGFIVLERGIEASLEKIKALLDMKLPKNLNETKQLADRVVALSKFIVRSTNKCLPFF